MSNPVTRLNAVLEGRYAKVALRVLKPELAVVVGAERFLAERPRRWMGLVFVASALGLLGCSGTTDPGPVTVFPGETLPLGTTVRVDAVGTYLLPAGATLLTTRCTGRVTVTFTPPGGATQNNTCESPDGSANQTNDVTGVTSVMYDLDADAFADVTAR